MTPFALWIYRLPFIVLSASVILLILAKLLKWGDSSPVSSSATHNQSGSLPPAAPADKAPGQQKWSARLWDLIRAHPWTALLLSVILAFLIILLFLAPPRLTGEIPIHPGLPGRPFYSLHWLRSSLTAHYSFFWIGTTLLLSLLSLVFLVWAVVRRSFFGIQVGLLVASLTLAALGQWMIGAGLSIKSWIAYGSAVAGFIVWAWFARRRLSQDLALQPPPSRWLEGFFLVLLLALTMFGRLYAFPKVPYGIEGDEAKWTYEAVNVMLDGRVDSSGEYHRDALPVSYYMESAFFHVLGPGIFSARLEVILTSVLATLLFYWLLRQIAPFPVAVLGSFLLSVSIFDISASRLANVESHVKLWPILALALLALASQTQRWQFYALSGLALALGLLTYDTLWPLALVVISLGLLEVARYKDSLKRKAVRFSALLLPPILTLPLLVPYALSRFNYYGLSSKGWAGDGWATFVANLGGVLSSWFIKARSDFLYNRDGPLLNSILLPFLVLGFVAVWFVLRHRFSHWILVWALLILLPVPILANSQMGRVVYPALPAVYALVALGMFLLWKEISRFLGDLAPVFTAVGVALLLWLPLFNFYIYFNEVADAQDRLVRREISDIALAAGGEDHLLLLPVVADTDEPLAIEYQVIEMALHARLPARQVTSAYQVIAYDRYLPMLTTNFKNIPVIEIVLDKTTSREREPRNGVAMTLLRCFPGGTLSPGTFFDRYTLTSAARENPACIPVDLDLSPAGSPSSPSLAWSLSQGYANRISLQCDRRLDAVNWVEAEQFTQAIGWKPETAYVTGWSSAGFLMDSYGSQAASYSPALPSDRPGYVWVRYLKRAADHSPANLSHGNQTFIFADTPADYLDTWIWERLGPYDPSPSEWILTRPYVDDPKVFMALFVDSFVFTTDPLYDPQTSQNYEPLPDKFVSVANLAYGTLPLDFPSGHYRCTATAFSSLPLVDALGNSPVASQPVEFDILK